MKVYREEATQLIQNRIKNLRSVKFCDHYKFAEYPELMIIKTNMYAVNGEIISDIYNIGENLIINILVNNNGLIDIEISFADFEVKNE